MRTETMITLRTEIRIIRATGAATRTESTTPKRRICKNPRKNKSRRNLNQSNWTHLRSSSSRKKRSSTKRNNRQESSREN